MRNKPTIDEVLPQVWAYRDIPGNSVGGSLHIVLDDGNASDSDVKFCIDHAEKKNDSEGARIGRLLLRMSRTQRLKIARRFYEVHEPESGT